VTARLDLASDPAVPQRDILLDLDLIARRLSHRLSSSGRAVIDSCRRECVSYRVGRRVRVVYRVGVNGRSLRVAASSFRSGKRSERAYERAQADAVEVGSFRPVLHDAGLNAVFWSFPNDRRLEHLPAAASASPDVARHLDKEWTRSRLMDYYPEASAVFRCLDDGGRVVGYAKVHAGDEGERTFRGQNALQRAARDSGLRIARPLAYSRQHKTLLVEAMLGRTIGELRGAELPAGLRAYGAALAALHSLPPVDLGLPVDSAVTRLNQRAEGMIAVRPDIELCVRSLLDELNARWFDPGESLVVVHGDTNENNAVLQDDGVAFIDFDRASLGPAASDLGNFIGLLRYLRSLGLISPGDERARSAAFLDGYSSVRSLPAPDSMRVHEATALAERAFRAVTRLRKSALLRIPALLQEARSMLHEARQ
jgi:Ser/Thr protein kinase RdoA (MazF antagonist)